MALKIVALADIHLGAKPYGLEEKKIDIYETFLNVLKYIHKSNPDLVIIAGDLFDSKSIDPKTFLVASALSKIKDKLFFCTGNHDPDLQYFMRTIGVNTSQIQHISLQDKVLGIARLDYQSNHLNLRKQINEIKQKVTAKRTILIGHFNLREKMPYLKNKTNYISRTDVRNFLFVIGGHIHNRDVIDNIIIPGSIERLDITNQDDRGFYEIILDDNLSIQDIKFKIVETRRIIVDDNISRIKKQVNNLHLLGKKPPIVFYTGDKPIRGIELLNIQNRCLHFEIKGNRKISEVIDVNIESESISSIKVKDSIEKILKKKKIDPDLHKIIFDTWGDKKELEKHLEKWINDIPEN